MNLTPTLLIEGKRKKKERLIYLHINNFLFSKIRYYLSGACEIFTALGRLIGSKYNSKNSFMSYEKLIPIFEKVLPNISLEHFSDVLDSVRMIVYMNDTIENVSPFLDWATNIIGK